jgi:NDP-sugar pyrophosphorylase family protein
MNKQLVIPMSGEGSRFLSAGFTDPKPLIKVLNKQIIRHIIEMYPGWDDILFIVNSHHFNDPALNLEQELKQIAPTAKISVISQHKNGPSFAVLKSVEYLINDGAIVINYCDFAGEFDLVDFEKKIFEFDCNLLTYTGFHPHMLRNSKYAYLLKENGVYSDIQEKKSYTQDPMSEEASGGAYSFKNKDLLISAIKRQIENNLNHNGEFYTSLTVKSVLQNGGTISTTKMSKFFQWGTPEDLEDFNYWNESISQIYSEKYSNMESRPNNVVALMGGLGNRLKTLIEQPKPLIPILGKTLWEQSLKAINRDSRCILIVRKELVDKINKNFFKEVFVLEENTKGQAHSAYLALEKVDDKNPITFLSTDCILPINFTSHVLEFMDTKDFDLVVWTASDYPPSLMKTKDYSYVVGDEVIKSVHIKSKPDKTEENQEVLTGNFTFRNNDICKKVLNKLFENKSELVNGEFYLDSSINIAKQLGLKVGKITVPNFLSIGTSDELLTFNYWCRK